MALSKLGVPEDTISLIQSFHLGMRAVIRLEGTLLEEISVENELRQGCCMAPVLFNLYTCLVVERLEELESLSSTSMMGSHSGGTQGMQVRGESLSASLLMTVLSWQQLDLVQKAQQ